MEGKAGALMVGLESSIFVEIDADRERHLTGDFRPHQFETYDYVGV